MSADQDDALCPTCGRIAPANWCNDDFHNPPLTRPASDARIDPENQRNDWPRDPWGTAAW